MDSKELDKIKDQLLQFVNGAKGATPLVRFIPLVCALDAAANYWCGRPSNECNGVVFKSFIGFYLSGYEKYSEILYNQLRCQLVHSFTLGKCIALTSSHKECHLKFFDWNARRCIESVGDPTAKSPLVINVEDFSNDVKTAIENLFGDADEQVPTIVGREGEYHYTFKGLQSIVSLGKVSDYEQVDKCIGSDNVLSSLDPNWLNSKLEDFGTLKKKRSFIKSVMNEAVKHSDRRICDNILDASKKIRLLRMAPIQEGDFSLGVTPTLDVDGQLTSTYANVGSH